MELRVLNENFIMHFMIIKMSEPQFHSSFKKQSLLQQSKSQILQMQTSVYRVMIHRKETPLLMHLVKYLVL